MTKIIVNMHPVFFLLIATTFEVCGDAIIRISIYNHTGLVRVGFAILGTIFLFGYGLFLNLTPVQFGQVAGLYVATLFVVWQVINYAFFRSLPTLPIVVGGSLIVTGGLIVTFWKL